VNKKSHTSSSWYKIPVHFLESCPSTMDVAKTYAKNPDLKRTSFFVTTRLQTNGRGRLGRTWLQSDIYDVLPLTLALANSELAIPLEWVSLIAGVAVYDTLLETYKNIRTTLKKTSLISQNNINLFLKWPNDLVWFENQKVEKLAGILCEAQVQSAVDSMSHVFIGIGLNLFSAPDIGNACGFFQKILNRAAQLDFTIQNRVEILKSFHSCLEKNLRKYLCHSHSVSMMRRLFLKRTFPIGTILSINQKNHFGSFHDLNKDGALVLKSDSGEIEKIYSSEFVDVIKSKRNILCIDFGNTRVHIKAQNELGEICHAHIAYEDIKSKKEFCSFENILKFFLANRTKKIEIFYVSVNSSKVTKSAITWIKRQTKKYHKKIMLHVTQITEKDIFKSFLIPKTFDYKTLGADRALKCVFCYEKAKQINKNVLIVSFGTATTCEGFSPNGIMIENFVFPGMQMSFDALHHFTALLPKLSAKELPFVSKQTYWTQTAYLQRGVLLSVVSTIFVSAQLHQPCHVILTGGNVDVIKQTLFEISQNGAFDASNIEIIDNIETNVLMNFTQKTNDT
jgi:biotin-[acetyl-CoA-carboxylase] ligase BirA-like protein